MLNRGDDYVHDGSARENERHHIQRRAAGMKGVDDPQRPHRSQNAREACPRDPSRIEFARFALEEVPLFEALTGPAAALGLTEADAEDAAREAAGG